MRILVTGASGFVGSSLIERILKDPLNEVVAASRQPARDWGGRVSSRIGHSLAPDTNWKDCLECVDAVVHLAARVHVLQEAAGDPLGEFRQVNVEGTIRLAEQAAEAGVRRFVFLSTIKVNGEVTKPGSPFHHDNLPHPVDSYGVSKQEAESALWSISKRTGMEVVVIRPPLVYGPGVRANFMALMKLVEYGVPLPLGGIFNKRSMIALDNLCDLIVRCLEASAAAGETFLAADQDALSTSELVLKLGLLLGKPPLLLTLPPGAMRWIFSLFGRSDIWQRLGESLEVDMRATCEILDWKPPLSVDDGLRRAVDWYVSRK